MTHLTRADLAERAEIVKALADAREIGIPELNAALARARDFRDGITLRQDDYYADRSDRWQESEAGELYSAWSSAWTYAELDNVANDDEIAYLEDLDNLPISPKDV